MVNTEIVYVSRCKKYIIEQRDTWEQLMGCINEDGELESGPRGLEILFSSLEEAKEAMALYLLKSSALT